MTNVITGMNGQGGEIAWVVKCPEHSPALGGRMTDVLIMVGLFKTGHQSIRCLWKG